MSDHVDGQESSNVDRLQFLFMNLVGHVVSVHAVDGSITEGLFVSRTDDDASEPSIMLSKTRNRRSATCAVDEKTTMSEIMLVPLANVVFVNAVGVRVEAAASGRVGHFRSNVLEMNWADLPPEDERAGATGSLEDEERNWETGKWDQFETNAKKFGVKTTYKEEMYTTTLDKTKLSKEQIEYADRAARDIERSQARGVQHRIERGEDVDVDEGTLYSDVQRGQAPADVARKAPAAIAGKTYTPPGTKKDNAPTSIEQQQQQVGGGLAPQPTVAAPSPSANKTSFNVNAKPFAPPGGSFGGAPSAGSSQPMQQSHAPQYTPIQLRSVNVDDMLAAVAAAMEGPGALTAPDGWEGEDDESTFSPSVSSAPSGFGSGYPPTHHHQHHMHHHHHHHHAHHQQHHAVHQHHSVSQHHYSNSSPVGGYGGGASGQQGGYPPQGQVGFRQPPATSSPLTDNRGVQQPLPTPQARLPTQQQQQPVAAKVSQQQPQQPVASAGPSGGPAPVSEEPRRAMTGLSRGRGGHSNPTRHEDPAPVAAAVPSTPNGPLGATVAPKKKGSK